MRMRRVRTLYVVLALVLLGVLWESIGVRPKFALSKDAQVELSRIPGNIQIKFVSDKTWAYTLAKGQLLMQNVKRDESGWLEHRPDIRSREDLPLGLPEVEGFRYYGPYQTSPNKSLILFSLAPKEDLYRPSGFVVVDMNDKKKLLYEKTEKDIEDLAWSPDSRMFVVLEKSSRRSFSLTGLIRGFFAHPIDVYTFYVSIYDLKGNRVLHTQIASGLIGASAQISWTN